MVTGDMSIKVRAVSDINVQRFLRMESTIDFNPPYQRESNVWTRATRQLFIDSIINGFDVPKLYLEVLSDRRVVGGIPVRYAVIDGKQRLETIIKFINGDFALDEEFRLYKDQTLKLGGLYFEELQSLHPDLAKVILNFPLPFVEVEASQSDLIEEMFERLNGSSPLNAAERRNAISGKVKDSVDCLAQHAFFQKNVKFKGTRYRYKEMATKFLSIEDQFDRNSRLSDTKAQTLLNLYRRSHEKHSDLSDSKVETFSQETADLLNVMAGLFEEEDRLLTSIGSTVVYYLCFRKEEFKAKVTREIIESFEARRSDVKSLSDLIDDYDDKEVEILREYNSLVQSSNDGSALSRRAEILTQYVLGYEEANPSAGLRE